jgi:hypothetical protein
VLALGTQVTYLTPNGCVRRCYLDSEVAPDGTAELYQDLARSYPDGEGELDTRCVQYSVKREHNSWHVTGRYYSLEELLIVDDPNIPTAVLLWPS